ncbi:MAG: single-stranded-DNA-specific exonuclease RecJ [Bacteroidaceae bacterium]|nr:single-stranded-DNA-specific exonuclease RecJ [Bacteroidaceae bacterium]
MNYVWNFVSLTGEQEDTAKRLAQGLNINPVLGRLLVNRGIKDVTEARRFFHPQLNELLDPFLFRDMDKAVSRLNQALAYKERILVYGDYDVDGCTAVALVYKFLIQYHTNIDYYIPNRNDEGYGVTQQGLDYAYETGVKLVIVLDCGIKAVEEIAQAKERGVDFIICDHHVPDDELPPAVAILNAKRRDGTYPYKDLSGCGVGFKLMQAFAQANGIEFSKLLPLLDFCVVSIASDLVPIMGENRILAFHGLRQINGAPSTGLRAIMNTCGLSGREVTMSDIIFRIGPRINASGRVQDGRATVALLVERDERQAQLQANLINHYNDQRKDLDKSMTEEANRIVAGLDQSHENKAIVLYSEEWHKGIIGIVASRLAEIYCRPSVVLARTEDMATGSARSVGDFDIYQAVESCRDLLENFGGHAYAVGLTMKVERVDEFRRRFTDYVEKHIDLSKVHPQIDIEATIDFRDITRRFFADLRRFNPFGPDNPRPVFCTKRVYDYGTSKVVGRDQEHIKLELVDGKSADVMNGIAFGQSSQARYIKTKQSFDIAYAIEENTHKRGEVQLQIEDIRPMNKL